MNARVRSISGVDAAVWAESSSALGILPLGVSYGVGSVAWALRRCPILVWRGAAWGVITAWALRRGQRQGAEYRAELRPSAASTRRRQRAHCMISVRQPAYLVAQEL